MASKQIHQNFTQAKNIGDIDLDEIEEDIEKDSVKIEKLFTCMICYDDVEKSNIQMLSGCSHMFCKLCFTDFYTSLVVEQNKHHSLKCP